MQVTAEDWALFNEAMDLAHESFNQKTILWRRFSQILDNFQEDMAQSTYEDIELKVLIHYNTFRTWPVNFGLPEGDLERTNCVLIINRNYLREQEHLTSEGNFNFGSRHLDQFIIQGIEYRNFGETEASQAYDDGVHLYIILQRQETTSGKAVGKIA